MPDTNSDRVSNDDVAQAVRDTLDLFLADHPDLRGNGRDVVCGDYEWSSDGQLLGLIIDGRRFTVTVQALDDEAGEGASC